MTNFVTQREALKALYDGKIIRQETGRGKGMFYKYDAGFFWANDDIEHDMFYPFNGILNLRYHFSIVSEA